MIKRILVATSLLCMCCILFAQNVQVKGKVVSENEAVEFANVVLQTKDSIFIAGGVTDSKGRFMNGEYPNGSYLLCISGMGYTSRIISLDHLAVSKDFRRYHDISGIDPVKGSGGNGSQCDKCRRQENYPSYSTSVKIGRQWSVFIAADEAEQNTSGSNA